MKRDWSSAEHKREQGCRVCGHPKPELAHVIGRIHDERRGKVAVVHPASVVPLCRAHHTSFDAHAFDLLPYLTVSEQARAVVDAGGIEAARMRITGIRP